jgi:hypothetical protein
MEEPIIEESTITIKEHLDDCSICLENIINEEHKKITTCNHIFHEECMARWMSLNHNCPLCRKNLDLDIYDEINVEENDDGDVNDDYDDYDEYDNPINRHINNSNTNNNISYNNTSLPDSLHVFAMNYNVLRIMSGMGGVSYSS